MEADCFDRLAKSLVRSETCRARGTDRPRWSSVACVALGRRHALKVGTGLALSGALRVFGTSDAVQADTVDDAQCPVPAGPCCAGFGRKRFAQSFKAKHTGLLTQVTVQVSGGSLGTINAFRIEIRKASRTGKPKGEALATPFQTPLFDRPPDNQTTPVVATFDPGAPVRKGKRYALVLTQTNGAPSVQLNLDGCGGALFEDDDDQGAIDNTFVKSPGGGDMVFATVVTI